MIGFYVSVRDGSRSGMLLGPYGTSEEAEQNVARARDFAVEVDPFAHFHQYGTARVERANALPCGRLNKRIGLWGCSLCVNAVPHTEHLFSNHVRVGAPADRSN